MSSGWKDFKECLCVVAETVACGCLMPATVVFFVVAATVIVGSVLGGVIAVARTVAGF